MFDCAEEYDLMLQKGISFWGEDKQYFIRERLQDLCHQLPVGSHPSRILDFGCGIDDTTKYLAEMLPTAAIIGFDTSDQAFAHAHQTYGSARISFCNYADFTQIEAIDLSYANGIFHRIIPKEKFGVIVQIHQVQRPGGYFALVENNPWNPGTTLVMKRIPFDRDAQLLGYLMPSSALRREGLLPFIRPAIFSISLALWLFCAFQSRFSPGFHCEPNIIYWLRNRGKPGDHSTQS